MSAQYVKHAPNQKVQLYFDSCKMVCYPTSPAPCARPAACVTLGTWAAMPLYGEPTLLAEQIDSRVAFGRGG